MVTVIVSVIPKSVPTKIGPARRILGEANFAAKIGPARPILVVKTGPPLPIFVPL